MNGGLRMWRRRKTFVRKARELRAHAAVVVLSGITAVLVFSGTGALADQPEQRGARVQADLSELVLRDVPQASPHEMQSEEMERSRATRYILELDDASVAEHVLALLRTGRTVDVVATSTAQVESLGATVEGSIEGAQTYLQVAVGDADLAALEGLERVRAVHRDEFIPMGSVAVRDPAPWHLDRIDQRNRPLDGRYHASTTGAGVLVYVVDSGLYPYRGNAEFDLSRTEIWYQSGFIAEDTLQGLDCNGHGTHVAGTIAGERAGVAPGVRLISIKANYACEGGFSTFDLLGWFNFIIANRADTSLPGRGRSVPAVVNLSLGSGTTSDLIDRGVAAMISNGITVVVAAGNEGDDACRYTPARVRSAITVGSTGTTDQRSSFSNFGACVDVLAPGEGVAAPYVNAAPCRAFFSFSPSDWDSGNCMAVGTALLSGTSMSSPIVAGVAARYLESNRGASPATVKRAIERGSVAILSNLGSRTPNRLANTLFVEGAELTRPAAPDLRSLQLGSSVTQPFSVRGGRAPVQYDVIAGSLPAGLSLAQSGAVNGQVNGFGSGSVTVRATDAVGRHVTISTNWASIGAPDVAGVGISVVPGNRVLVASWGGGSFDGAAVARGAEVSRVEVRATPEAGGRARVCVVSRRVGRGASLTNGCTVTGLVNDTPHQMDVRAQNRGGWTAWTQVSGLDAVDRTPVPVAPTVVRSLRVQPASGVLQVTWAAPSADGGAPPSYDVQVRRVGSEWPADDGGPSGLVCSGLPSRQRSCAVTSDAGLEWGAPHEVRVRATNSQGASDWITSARITPFSTPGLDGFAVDVAPGTRLLGLGWSRPEMDSQAVARGGPISRVEVRAVPDGGGTTRSCVVTRARSGVLPDGCSIANLDAHRQYRIEVRAQNRAGWTNWKPVSSESTIRRGLALNAAGRWIPDVTPVVTEVRAEVGDDGTIHAELDVRSGTDLVEASVRVWDVTGARPEPVSIDCDRPMGPSEGTRRAGTWTFTCDPVVEPGTFVLYRVTAGTLRAASGTVGHVHGDLAALTVRSSDLAILGPVPADVPASSGELTISSGDGQLTPGETYDVAGAGFLPASEVRLVVYPEGLSVASFVVGSDGAFEGAVAFDDPEDLAPRTLAAVGIDAAGRQLRSLTAQVSFDRAGPEVVELFSSGGMFSLWDVFTVPVTVRDPSGVDGVWNWTTTNGGRDRFVQGASRIR
jgi:subtilisin family serine protease